MADIVLTDEQERVVSQALAFIDDPCPEKQFFYYEGEAGTGKSEVMAAIAHARRRGVLCAYTGKAASVLTRKSGLPADTIHSFIYNFSGENKETGAVYFSPKYEDRELKGDVALVDEMSMLGDYLMKDFLATGCKIVAAGDLGQLPPVKDSGFFQRHKPDARLLHIHRQAWDSPIIRQSYAIRRNADCQSDGPDFRVVPYFSMQEAVEADMVLCWRNATRHHLNTLIRQWKGLPAGVIKAGEPVMGLKRNHKDIGVLNGAVYTLAEDHTPGAPVMWIFNERGRPVEVSLGWIETFEPEPVVLDRKTGRPKDTVAFALSYAATCHKAQGSQWDRVIVVDEYPVGADWRKEWLTTAVTRAAKSIIVQRNL